MNSDDELFVLLAAATLPLIHYILNKRRKRRDKKQRQRLWTQKWLQRRQQGLGVTNILQNEFRMEDPESCKKLLRMCREHFDELLNMVKNDISTQHTNMRQSVTAEQRLAITLRFLATGETYRSLMFATRVHESTISIFVPQVCSSIYNNLKDEYLKMPENADGWKQKAVDFEKSWNIPLCLGVLHGKHISFRPPRSATSSSIVLLTLTDASYKFTYVDVSVNGDIRDGGAYEESTLKEGIDLDVIPFPSDVILPGEGVSIPYTFIADDAFPLSNRIMKPYSSGELTTEKLTYNYRLSRARQVGENSFRILANRFRILLTSVNLCLDTVEDITLACCALHNFLTTKNPARYADISENVSMLRQLQQCQSENQLTDNALTIRDAICEYVNTNSVVPCQNNCLE